MTAISAATTGASVGLAYFAGLWVSVQQLARRPRRHVLLAASQIGRLGLAGGVFYGLSLEGADRVLAGLGGFLVARWLLVRKVGGVP
jgi:F1F0 ATPase subunit 2